MYSINSRVRYSETDSNGKLSPEALLNYFQDCSTFHSEDIGLGLAWLLENKRVWLMTAWQIIIKRCPALGERIIVGTAPYEFRAVLGCRNFWLTTEAGEQLAYANSIWTLLDTETGRPTKASAEIIQGYGLSERLPMDYAPRKIELSGPGRALPPIEVRHHQLDTNNHMNNNQYIRIALECAAVFGDSTDGWEKNLTGAGGLHQLRAEYRKSAVLGDTIYPVLIAGTELTMVISLQDKAGAPFCNVELTRKI